MITIIVPCYNHERYIEKCLLSILNQSFTEFKLVVVDDGSTDGSYEIIKQLSRSFNFVHYRQNNMGLSATLNSAIKQYADSEYICVCASDDYLHNDKFRASYEFLKTNRQYDAVYTNGYIIDEDDNVLRRFSQDYLVPASSNVYKELMLGNWIPMLGMLMKTKALLDIGLFDTNLAVEDYDLLLRFSRVYRIGFLNKPLFFYRKHLSNFSNDSAKMKEEFQKVVEKHINLNEYLKFKNGLKQGKLWDVIKHVSLFNLGMIWRSIIRKIQLHLHVEVGGVGVLLTEMWNKICVVSFSLIYKFYLVCCGVKVGQGCRFDASIRISGNKRNLKIGNRVCFAKGVVISLNKARNIDLLEIRDDTQICQDVILNTHYQSILIEDRCFIGPRAIIQGKVVIGRLTMIAANTAIFASNHIVKELNRPFVDQGEYFKGITISENCWLGANVTVLDGVFLDRNTIVGAGSILKGRYKSDSTILAKGMIGVETK